MDAATCLALASACLAIDYSAPPPADFPQLAVTVHEYDGLGANAACRAKYRAHGHADPVAIVACIEANFHERTCDAYVPKGNAYWLDFELAKCAGYGSIGESVPMAEKWRAWKQLYEAKTGRHPQ